MAVTAAKQDIMDTDWHFGGQYIELKKPEWVSSSQFTDKYIKQSEKNMFKTLKERKVLGNQDYLKVKDHGLSYHSTPLNGDPDLKELEQYVNCYILEFVK